MEAREHGIPDLSHVDMAVLEVDGSISIVAKESGKVSRTRRRIRQLRRR
jgi:uncharacterized membrane protein YcaP (DUF421 family)